MGIESSDKPVPIGVAIGDAVRRARGEHRVTRDALARAGAEFGASWGRTTIENIETGKFAPTISTLYLLCRALSAQTRRHYALLDLLPADGQLEVSDGFAVSAARLRRFLGDHSTPEMVGESFDEFVRGLASPPLPPTLAETRAAKRLSIEPADLQRRAYELWGEPLDAVVAHSAGADASPQARGHETRRRVEELRASLTRPSRGTDG